MTIVEDASTPAVVTLTGDTTGIITTASFTPPANSLLVAVLNVGYASSVTPGMTLADSAGGTWTLGPNINNGAGHSWIWYQYLGTSPGAITVTATDTQTTSAGRQLAVRVDTGAHRLQGPAHGAASMAVSNTGSDFSLNCAEEYAGSWMYYTSVQNANEVLTPTAATTTISSLADTTDVESLAIGRKTTPTGTPGGVVSLGWTGNNATGHTMVGLEVIPATASPVPSFTVTATQGGSTGLGMVAALYAVTGQASNPVGATATASALSATITPNASGSLVFGSSLSTAGTLTALGGTTILATDTNSSLRYAALVSSSPPVAGTPVTFGVTSSGGTGISTALLEVLTGAGSLAMFIGSAGETSGSSLTAVTSNPIAPPAGSLLIAIIESNGNAGTTTMAVTDNSRLGLTWTEQVKLNGAGNGYAGIWTAVMPGTTPTTLFGQAGGTTLASDGSSYTLGMEFTLAVNTPLTGIWFNSPATADATPAGCVILQRTGSHAGSVVTGTLNNNGSWSGPPGSGWVRCGFDGSVTLTAGTVYQVAIDKQSGVNVYGATSHYWDGAGPGNNGLTSGVVVAPSLAASSDVSQDSFVTGGSWPAYPTNVFNAGNYWIDVEVTPVLAVVTPMLEQLPPIYQQRIR